MDEIDTKALGALMENGRITWAELAGILGMTPPSAADRVRRLEERGVIRGYAALVAPEAVGLALAAFIAVTLDRPEHRAAFLQRVARMPEVLECHHMAGDYDYLLKVRCRDTHALERLISDEIKALPGVARTVTTIVLSTVKESLHLPLGSE